MAERTEKKLVCIDDTKFIWKTNFSGDPERDNFGSDVRKGCVIIPTEAQARELMNEGFNVRRTEPRPDEDVGFEPTYYVSVTANYKTSWPPKVFLVCGDAEPRLLDEESVDIIDKIRVKNVNVVLNPYYNNKTHRASLYVRTMYVEQDIEADPYADRYNWGRN